MANDIFIKFKQAHQRIESAERVLLVTHGRPDGDALSSLSAAWEYIQGLDKAVRGYCQDPAPPQFGFLPHVEGLTTKREELDFPSFDLIIVLDCGQKARTGLVSEIDKRRPDQFLIEFDHHPKIDDYAELEIRDTAASSTAELLYRFFEAGRVRISKNLATCILTGIMTDTGNLLYEATTDYTVQVASKMLLYGARYPQVLQNTWRNKSLDAMRVWGQAMSNLEINQRYNFAYSVLPYAVLESSRATEEEFEGIAGFLSGLSEVKGLVLLREEKPGFIKGSLRTSDPDVDVSLLAQRLGGGGHRRASGFTLEGKIVKTEQGWSIE